METGKDNTSIFDNNNINTALQKEIYYLLQGGLQVHYLPGGEMFISCPGCKNVKIKLHNLLDIFRTFAIPLETIKSHNKTEV
jgi:hypothetical protein